MAWCLTAPSHYLHQNWININGVMWHSHKSYPSETEFLKWVWIVYQKSQPSLQGANELTHLSLDGIAKILPISICISKLSSINELISLCPRGAYTWVKNDIKHIIEYSPKLKPQYLFFNYKVNYQYNWWSLISHCIQLDINLSSKFGIWSFFLNFINLTTGLT